MKKEQHSDLETTPKTAKSCQPLHYFVDESGDGVLFDRRGRPLVLAEGWPQYFMVGLLDVADPEALQQDMDDLRRRLLTDPYFSGVPSMKPEAGKQRWRFMRRTMFQRCGERCDLAPIFRTHGAK